MTQTQKLALERIRELGRQAYTAHQEYAKWRPEPLNATQQSELSLKLQQAVEKQYEWIQAMLADEEEQQE
jgi:heterodisulfide reductase subunit C